MSVNKVSVHTRFVGLALLFVLLCVTVLLSVSGLIFAADYPKLNNRSLSIGSSAPGTSTDYAISWRWPSNTSIGSVRFLLCADPYVLDPCGVTPPGDMSGATLTSQSGTLGGFAISSQTSDEVVLSRGGAGGSGIGQYTFVLDNVINPTGTQQVFYIQIFTYSTTNASGTPNHMSSVASATASPIMINTDVPPILYFCAAVTITEWCDSVNGNFIDYGDLSPAVEDIGTSQFGVATNALGGYVVTINGNTMASGNKLIDALSVPTASSIGSSQFGLNLRANTLPPFGQDVAGAGIGVVAPDYDTPDLFKYADGDMVASAATGSLFNIYTVTYVVNVPPDQPSGIYNTTVTYICTAAF